MTVDLDAGSAGTFSGSGGGHVGVGGGTEGGGAPRAVEWRVFTFKYLPVSQI